MADQEASFATVNPQAAGIDIGSRSHWVCVGQAADEVREFGAFTDDLHAIAHWLQAHHIRTVAMESTGPYWKCLFVLLQDYGLEVILVNAKHIKQLKGKKTDLLDSQWLQRLHSCGLLSGSFQPDAFTEKLRPHSRHRQHLLETASSYLNRMQKALVLMNIQLPSVLRDISGKTGLRIIEAILGGERNATRLAELADPRVKAKTQTLVKALTGQWREEYILELQDCYEIYQFHWQKIRLCDQRIEALLLSQAEVADSMTHPTTFMAHKVPAKNAPALDLPRLVYTLSGGVDLSEIEGVSHTTLLTLLAETGLKLADSFGSAKQFAAWLGLTPNHKISGGRILSRRTQPKKHRLAAAFRASANAVARSKTHLGEFFRRVSHRRGRSKAITATARKIAVIVYQMLSHKQAYNPTAAQLWQDQQRKRKIKAINRLIHSFGVNQTELVFAPSD